MKHAWIIAQNAHHRLTKLAWSAGWAIPLAALGLAISIAYWRVMAIESTLIQAQQIDYEDGRLCAKFGFVEGADNHQACKLDLLELRRSHEELIAATSVP